MEMFYVCLIFERVGANGATDGLKSALGNGWGRLSLGPTLLVHEGETHPKKPPTQMKTQFAQTISEQLVQTVPTVSL